MQVSPTRDDKDLLFVEDVAQKEAECVHAKEVSAPTRIGIL